MEFVDGGDGETQRKGAAQPYHASAGVRSTPGAEEKKTQNSVLGQMGKLADHEVQQIEGFRRHPTEKHLQDAARVLGREGIARSNKNDRGPEECRQQVPQEFLRGRVQIKRYSSFATDQNHLCVPLCPSWLNC